MYDYFPTSYGPLYPPDELRNYGVHLVAAIGAGKSPVLGRGIAFYDFMREVPTVILDNGNAIDNFLHKFLKLPKPLREQLWSRIRYVDLSGNDGYVFPFSLYYRLDTNEDVIETAERFIRTILRISPSLQSANIQGEGAIRMVLQSVGAELVNRGWQISELTALTKKIPDSLAVRLHRFTYSDTERAIYAADKPGIDWQEVIDKNLIVLLDYRHIESPQFALSWVLDYFFTFLKHRGMHQSPISLIIDEFSMLQEGQGIRNEDFTNEWNEILNNIMKSHNLWLYIAHQTMGQFDATMADLLLAIQTQVIGKTMSTMSARALSQQLARIDPYKVKRMREIERPESYESMDTDFEGKPKIQRSRYYVERIEEPIYSSSGEQYLAVTDSFRDIPRLHFTVYDNETRKSADHSIKGIEKDYDIKSSLPILEEVRKALMRKHGRGVEEVLAEIAARTQQPAQRKVAEQKEQPYTLPVKRGGRKKDASD